MGTVSYFGDDITGVPAERLPARGLLLVVGGRAVFTDMTVHENLDMQAITAQMEKPRLKERREGRLRDVSASCGVSPTEGRQSLRWRAAATCGR